MAGSLVFQNKFNNKLFELDLTDLPAGLYFIKIISEDNYSTYKISKY
jgi:hypothetical protein